MAYSWQPYEAIQLCEQKVDTNRKEIYVDCPFCGRKKKFAFNLALGIGHCFYAGCNQSADSASYYAAYYGITVKDARCEIEKKLGITPIKPGEKRPERIVKKMEVPEERPEATDAEKDKTYRALLKKLPLAVKSLDNLKSRGFTEDCVEQLIYRTFPTYSEVNYFQICKELLAEGCKLDGVAGFYKYNGSWTFVQITKGTIMPSVNYRNQIVGLQIRKDDDARNYDDEKGEYEAKCAWFSSTGREYGTKAHAGVHYACDFKYSKSQNCWFPVFKEGFFLTEGIMKADLIHQLMPHIPVIAVPGVNALTSLEKELKRIKFWGGKQIVLAYDMDYLTNENVQAALQNTRKLIEDSGLKFSNFDWETDIDVNGQKYNLKGLDDYLAWAKLGILPNIK